MQSITKAVRSLFDQDETAREAALRGILNHSAYAREITPQVETATWKEVEESTVAVAVNRVASDYQGSSLKPKLSFDKVSVETGLIDVSFERTAELSRQLNQLLPAIKANYTQDMYVESTSQREITMIMSKQMWQELSVQLDVTPKGFYENQIAISISFNQDYLTIPNFIYAVLGIFALHNINLTEIVSTMTEIVVVVSDEYLDVALSGLKPYMR